jgi:hypothetical protein
VLRRDLLAAVASFLWPSPDACRYGERSFVRDARVGGVGGVIRF